MMDAYMNDARPPDGSDGPPSKLTQPQMGWHRKMAMYSMGFYDGHSEYRHIDTRYTSGPGWNTWGQPDTSWVSCQ